MAKILDNQCCTVPQPKMIELRKGFVINGQYYLKENMQPVPFNTIAATDQYEVNTNWYMHLDKRICFNKVLNQSAQQVNSKVLYDSDDDRITYVLFESGNYTYLEKFKEENNTCTIIIKKLIKNGYDYWDIQKIDNHKEGLSITITGTGNKKTLQILNKDTFALIRQYDISSANSNTSYTYDSDTIIENNFIFASAYGNNLFSYYVESLNKYVDLTLNGDVAASTSANYRNRVYYNNTLVSTDKKVSVAYPLVSKNSGMCVLNEMWIVTFDKENNVFMPLEKVKVRANASVIGDYYGVSLNWSSDLWHRTINGKNYIFIYNRYNFGFQPSRMIVLEEKTVTENEVTSKIYEVIKVQNFPMGQCGQIITFPDDTKLKFYGYSKAGTAYSDKISSVYCYELDETTLDMIKTFNENGIIREFGFDKDKNLYILWDDMSVSRHNERTVANFNAKFENGLYEYQGEDIETNLIISTTNLEGKLLAKEVKLDIRGNAKFKANGTKTITVTTLEANDLKVPVIITGAGALSIFPKIKA